MLNFFKSYLLNLWARSHNFSNLSFLEKILFIFLLFFEKIYLVCFKLVIFFKKKLGNKKVNFKVISVGNLSVGGTGKSVFVQFLAENLKNRSAIISRGYGASKDKSSKSKIVSDGNKIFYPASIVGDEPFMIASNLIARNLKIPVIVGKNRFESVKLLSSLQSPLDAKTISYVILDDGYQNFLLKKDFEILLLDARKPFENGHCLPAGRLREKDFSRSDAIIFTHADKVKNKSNNFFSKLSKKNLFYGKHKFSKLLYLNKKEILPKDLKSKKILAFAGIGSFGSFIQSIKDLKFNIAKEIEYPDHHQFIEQDIKNVLKNFKKYNCDCIITTSKDWVKVISFLSKIKDYKNLPIYVLEIEFAFLTDSERIRFLSLVESVLNS